MLASTPDPDLPAVGSSTGTLDFTIVQLFYSAAWKNVGSLF